MSFVRSKAEEYGIAKDFNKRTDVHIHVPEGAIPKDGPSAASRSRPRSCRPDARADPEGRRDDRRNHTPRQSVADRRRQREGPRRASRRRQEYRPAERQREGSGGHSQNVLDTLNVYMVQTMDEVLRVALAEPLAGRLPAEAQAAPVDSAMVDDTITH